MRVTLEFNGLILDARIGDDPLETIYSVVTRNGAQPADPHIK